MASSPLSNYLRTHRKRLGLSQDEVAFLLGSQSGSRVSRNEQFVREPDLVTALTYEAIFQRPVRELFAGLYREIEQLVAARAVALAYRIALRKQNRQTAHKRKSLARITDNLNESRK